MERIIPVLDLSCQIFASTGSTPFKYSNVTARKETTIRVVHLLQTILHYLHNADASNIVSDEVVRIASGFLDLLDNTCWLSTDSEDDK